MKIDKIEIAGFGKLNNFTLDFDGGLNLILGENESGKSTICDFLLCMLYDMPNDGKRATLSENLRRKYKPWKGESFGGRIFFTDDSGKKFILEKSFGKTQRSDRSKLLDAESWAECDSGENIGERLFGLSREGFLKTLYIKSLDIGSMSGGGEEVLAKLSNMETSGDEDVSYLNIKNALEKEMFSLLSKTGRGGKIASLQEEERLLSLELSKAEMASESLKNDEIRMRELKEKINELEKNTGSFEKLLETAIRHEKFLSQKKSSETEAMIKKRLEVEEKRLSELLENKNESATAENIEALEAELRDMKIKQENLPAKKVFAIPLIALALLITVGFLIKKVIPFTVSGVLVSLAATIVFYVFRKSKYNNLNLEIADIERKIDDFNKQNSNDQQIKETEKTIEELKESLSSFEIEKEEFSIDEMEYKGDSSSEITAKIRMYKERLKALNNEHLSLSVSVAAKLGGGKTKDEIQSEIKIIKDEIEKCQKEYNAYKKCAEWMEKAHDEIKQNYAPLLNKKTEEIFKTLTKNKYNGVRLSEELALNYKNEYDEIVESGHLSKGAYDLLYISLKFSAMGILCEKIPPVILDDAFIQLDDERLKLMVDFIKNNEKFSQVILFTCHKKTSEIFKDVKILELI